jgi:hypothetical protein
VRSQVGQRAYRRKPAEKSAGFFIFPARSVV